jgi:Spy/CpxP family protein refolding chaperone
MRNKFIAVILALGLSLTAAAQAQTVTGGGQGEPANQQVTSHDPIGDALVQPDVVMSHQQELGLTDAQRNAILADVTRAQQRFTQLQWQIAAATEKLASILGQPRVDQSKALAQLDAELQLEREAKRTQLQMMIEVKNELTPDQQAKAMALQRVRPQ